ncbi:MAG: hypothetical protein FWG37_04135 [Clostridia bacterium]|nr:hypothetical protein [Clostridia bacterium]
MRKINSNGYAGRVILVGLSLIVLGLVLRAMRKRSILPMPLLVVYAPLAIGSVVLLGFGVLLGVELWQDKRLNRYYLGRKRTRIVLENGQYECQSCGYRDTRNMENACPACGAKFVSE